MKKEYTLLIFLLSLSLLGARVSAQQSANASGGNATGSGGSASYSVGQVAYTAVAGTTVTANEGVQQPYEFFATGIDNVPGVSLLISAYPNPVQSVLSLKIENLDLSTLSYQLFDVDGSQVISRRPTDVMSEVPMSSLPAATYVLRVLDGTKQIKSFTIIKKQ